MSRDALERAVAGPVRWRRWIPLAGWSLIAGFLATRFRGEALDDFFITYRYAANLAAGHGFVFNPGEKVFGLTNPGLALLLAAIRFAARGVGVPAAATVVFALSLVGLCLLLLADAEERGRRAEALWSGTLLVASSYLWALQGGEGVPMLFLLVAAARLGTAWPVLSGVIAGLAVWFRPEAALGVAALALLLWIERRSLPARFAAAAATVAALGAGAAWWYFGSPVPNSLAAKQAMGAAAKGVGAGADFWSSASGMAANHGGPLWRLLLGVGILGCIPVFRHGGRGARVLVLLAAALAVAYPLVGVPFFAWYSLPVAVVVLLGAVQGVGMALRSAANASDSLARRLAIVFLAAVAACLLGFLPLASVEWYRHHRWPPYMERYKSAALWLRENSPPDSTVAYYEVGALGYFSDRTIIDLAGIVTPQLLPYLQRWDMESAFLARPADYALLDRDRGGWMPAGSPWFASSYEVVQSFGPSGETRILRRKPGALPPPPREGGKRGATPRSP